MKIPNTLKKYYKKQGLTVKNVIRVKSEKTQSDFQVYLRELYEKNLLAPLAPKQSSPNNRFQTVYAKNGVVTHIEPRRFGERAKPFFIEVI